MVSGRYEGFDGEVISGISNIIFKLRELDIKDVESFLTSCVRFGKYAGKSVKFMQILFPDGNGIYPEDPACDFVISKIQSLVGLK